MVRVRLSLRESIEEAAAKHFEAAKKARRKLHGALETIERASTQAGREAAARPTPLAKPDGWHAAFRWTRTPKGTLIVAGKDASSNEALLKRHADDADTVCHSELAGSPFAVIKGAAADEERDAACQFVAAYSSAWKRGLAAAEAFCVSSSQVSKTAQAGEYLAKGSFMIRGAKDTRSVPVTITLGIIDGVATSGTEGRFTATDAPHATLVPGKTKTSEVAKTLAKRLGGVPDDWLPLVPPGGSDIVAVRRGRKAIKSDDAEGVTER